MLKILSDSLQVLEEKHKIKLLFIIFLASIGTLLEIVSLSSIYNLINNILDIQSTESNILVFYFNNFLSFLGLKPSLENTILFVVIIFLIKFIFFIYLYYTQYSLINYLRANLSTRLLKNYLKKNYIFHINNGATKLIRNTETEVSQFVTGVISSFLVIFTELIIMMGILYLLYIANPFVLISSSLVFIIVSSIYIIFTKNYILKLGQLRQLNTHSSLKALFESLQGIKNTKVFQAENFFLKYYFEKLKNVAKTSFILSLFNHMPKLGLELLIVFCGSIIVMYFSFNSNLNLEIVSSISLFGLAAFKILPSITKFIVSFQNIRFNKPSIDVIKNEIISDDNKKFLTINKKPIEFNNSIRIFNISYKYPNTESEVFNSINFNINKLDKIGIYGKSGSGKTTFVDLVIGLLQPTSGEIFIDDKKLDHVSNFSWINNIGYVPQKMYLVDDTVRQNIAFGFDENDIDDDQIIDAAKKSNSFDFIDNLTDKFQTKIGENGSRLSGGQCQRLAIARCFYKKADLIIFDEPTSSLDESSEQEVMSSISKLNSTVIIISHKKELLNFCSKIFEIKEKKFNLIK